MNSCTQASLRKPVPKAVKGVIDLNQWNFEQDGPVPLDGEWEFYWNELLAPDDMNDTLQANVKYFHVPVVWNDDQQPEALPGKGFGTYKLQIILNDKNDIYAVTMGEVYTAYKLWIDQKLIFSTGIIGKNKDSSFPKMHPQTTHFTVEDKNIEILIQVSNFSFKNGGLRNAIEFGLGYQLQDARESSLILDYILFGSVFIMAIYHFGLFGLHRKDTSTFYFGLFCLIIASRILVTGEAYVATLFSGLNWGIHLKIIVLGYYMALPTLITFFYRLYPQVFHRPIIKFFQIIGIAASFLVLVSSMSVYIETETIYQIIILIAFIYVLGGLLKATKEKREGTIWVIGGFLVLFATAINDIGYANQIMLFQRYQNLLPIGLFIFIFSQSYILSVRFTNAFKLATKLEGEKLTAQTKVLKAERTMKEMLKEQVEEKASQVTTLKGLIPICSSCKKIRDDEGYWQQVEKYVSDHSEVEFSHGICPDCKVELYPEIYKDDDD